MTSAPSGLRYRVTERWFLSNGLIGTMSAIRTYAKSVDQYKGDTEKEHQIEAGGANVQWFTLS